MDLELIKQQMESATEELIAAAHAKPSDIFIVGCSSSEVVGNKIGTGGSSEVALLIFKILQAVTAKYKLFLAIQCCEHLNRALVVDANILQKYDFDEVTVKPMPHAGGALATAAYENFEHPIVVENIKAHLGLDIGQTLIGMHLKRVAVPVRLKEKYIGNAVLTAARTRPPLIGGERAHYPDKIR